MRLLKEESIKITNLLEKYFSREQYQLVKKRGWVHIIIDGNSFAFHRHDTAAIMQGKLEHSVDYSIRADGPARSVNDLDGLLNALEKWLKTH